MGKPIHQPLPHHIFVIKWRILS